MQLIVKHEELMADVSEKMEEEKKEIKVRATVPISFCRPISLVSDRVSSI